MYSTQRARGAEGAACARADGGPRGHVLRASVLAFPLLTRRTSRCDAPECACDTRHTAPSGVLSLRRAASPRLGQGNPGAHAAPAPTSAQAPGAALGTAPAGEGQRGSRVRGNVLQSRSHRPSPAPACMCMCTCVHCVCTVCMRMCACACVCACSCESLIREQEPMNK